MTLPITDKKQQQPMIWSDLPWGKYYLSTVEHYFSGHWSKIFGFHLAKIGALSTEVNSISCAISHQIAIDQQMPATIIADPCYLPLLDKSIDACLIANTLNYCQDAHQLLREIDRVLIDDGYLLLSSFNPFSLVGLCNQYWKIRNTSIPAQLFSQWRIKDWLALLNYEVIDCVSLQALPWRSHFTKPTLLSRACGCLNMMVARKRTIPITMIRLPRRATIPILTKPIVGATQLLNPQPLADNLDHQD